MWTHTHAHSSSVLLSVPLVLPLAPQSDRQKREQERERQERLEREREKEVQSHRGKAVVYWGKLASRATFSIQKWNRFRTRLPLPSANTRSHNCIHSNQTQTHIHHTSQNAVRIYFSFPLCLCLSLSPTLPSPFSLLSLADALVTVALALRRGKCQWKRGRGDDRGRRIGGNSALYRFLSLTRAPERCKLNQRTRQSTEGRYLGKSTRSHLGSVRYLREHLSARKRLPRSQAARDRERERERERGSEGEGARKARYLWEARAGEDL